MLQGINPGDLDGKYFDTGNYVISGLALNTFVVTATAPATLSVGGVNPASGMIVSLNQDGTWSQGATPAALQWL